MVDKLREIGVSQQAISHFENALDDLIRANRPSNQGNQGQGNACTLVPALANMRAQHARTAVSSVIESQFYTVVRAIASLVE